MAASYDAEFLLLSGAFTVTCWHGPEEEYLSPDWVFPVGASTPSHAVRSKLPLARSRDPRIPPLTVPRLILVDYLGVVALLEGYPGIPHPNCPLGYRAVWVKNGEDPASSEAKLTPSDLQKDLTGLSGFPSSGVWLVPMANARPDMRKAVQSLLKRHHTSTKERGKILDKGEKQFARSVFGLDSVCAISGGKDAVQAAHVIALAMGTTLLGDIMMAISSITKAWRKWASDHPKERPTPGIR
ncbi:hypothetical protein C8R44DRAFT_62363 [Mycena epipterygia]|nr:hypothetical protein C8R44DRAFT_62363 [Mycena epipterygia]